MQTGTDFMAVTLPGTGHEGETVFRQTRNGQRGRGHGQAASGIGVEKTGTDDSALAAWASAMPAT